MYQCGSDARPQQHTRHHHIEQILYLGHALLTIAQSALNVVVALFTYCNVDCELCIGGITHGLGYLAFTAWQSAMYLSICAWSAFAMPSR